MKLVNLNISIKLDNSADVIAFLRKEDADVVTLQEVVRAKEGPVHESFKSKEALDAALGDSYPYRFFSPLWSSGAQPKRDFGGVVEQGNYILSKHLITASGNYFFYRDYEHIDDWSTFRTHDHPRAVQVVEIAAGNNQYRILNIHGIWTETKEGDERTERECEFVAGLAKEKNMPTIIAGDFNLLPQAQSLESLNKDFKNLNVAFGIQSTRPDFQDTLESGQTMVDYIFVSKEIRTESLKTVNVAISDHLPLVLIFG